MDKSIISQDRLKILSKIEEYERLGRFDEDVEDDPPTIPLRPCDVDFLNKKLSSKIKTAISNYSADKFFRGWMKTKKVIYSGARGLENLNDLKSGAMVTCNHFNVFDNFAVLLALKEYYKNFVLYKIIREGNYNMKGKVGVFLRHSNTLPLSQNAATMKNCIRAVDELLKRKKLILIYPEQGMWWNYKKIRPFKSGAFHFAAKNNVPIVPCFITLHDSELLDADNYPVQEYTVHIMPLIYPDKNKSLKENAEEMKEKNYSMCKAKYEEIYGEKMVYTTQSGTAEY